MIPSPTQNFRRRGFDFEAATETFFDEYAEFSYKMEWQGEERYQVVGRIPVIGIVVVIFVIWYFEGSNEKVYRIISARRANKREENRYRVRFQ